MLPLLVLLFGLCLALAILLKPRNQGISYAMLGAGIGLLAIAGAVLVAVIRFQLHLVFGIHPYIGLLLGAMLGFLGLVVSVVALAVK